MFRDGKQISKYSKWEDIQRAIKPLLKAHGFTLSFSNNFPSPREIEVVAILTHKDGHHTENAFRLTADETGHKNDNQALGSSQSYGMRYATLGLLNMIRATSCAMNQTCRNRKATRRRLRRCGVAR
jgi:hypothetical protein